MRYFCQKYQHLSTMNKGQMMGNDAGLTLMGMNEKLEKENEKLKETIKEQQKEIDIVLKERREGDEENEKLEKRIKLLEEYNKLHNDLIDLLRKEKQELYNRARRAEAIAEDERFRICPICRKDNGYKKLENMLKDR